MNMPEPFPSYIQLGILLGPALAIFVVVIGRAAYYGRWGQLRAGAGKWAVSISGAVTVALLVASLFLWKAQSTHTVMFLEPHHVGQLHGATRQLAAAAVSIDLTNEPAEEKPTPAVKIIRKSSKQPRPEWVETPSTLDNDTYQATVIAGPYLTRAECDGELARLAREKTAGYAVNLHGSAAAVLAEQLADAWLLKQVVRDTWEETVEVSVGPMVQLHARLVYDTKVRQEVDLRWHKLRVHDRLQTTAAIGLGLLGSVAMAYGWLRRATQR